MSKIQIATPDGSVTRDMTVDEQTQHDAFQAQAALDKTAEAEAKAQKATDKTNGNQKLLDLGLSQAEVDALTG
jgi:hypothetical protein